MQYYQQISRFALNGDAIDVTEDNEHLGIIVSGDAEEQKDVDIILQLCRASMFTLLTGPRCHLKHKFISGSSTVSQSYAITENMDQGNISNLFDVVARYHDVSAVFTIAREHKLPATHHHQDK